MKTDLYVNGSLIVDFYNFKSINTSEYYRTLLAMAKLDPNLWAYIYDKICLY